MSAAGLNGVWPAVTRLPVPAQAAGGVNRSGSCRSPDRALVISVWSSRCSSRVPGPDVPSDSDMYILPHAGRVRSADGRLDLPVTTEHGQAAGMARSAGVPAAWPCCARRSAGECPAATSPDRVAAQVGLLSFRVAGPVAAAAVGQAGLAGERVGLLDVAADDLLPVGQHERRPGAGRGGGCRGLARGLVLGRPDPGDHGGGQAQQPAAPPGPRAAAPARYLRRGQALPHLHQQRGVQDIGPFDVGGEPEHMDPGAGIGAGHYDALAAHRGGDAADQVGLDAGPRAVDVDDAVGRVIGLRPFGGQEDAVDAVLGHQFGGLGGQCLCLRGRDAFGLGLGQQLPDAGEQRFCRLGSGRLRSCCLGIHEVASCSGSGDRIRDRTLSGGSDISRTEAALPAPYRGRAARAWAWAVRFHPGRHPVGRPEQPRLGRMAVQMAPSILASDFARLADEAAAVAGVADWLHVDVMDNHFVPNLTIGLPVVEALLKHAGLPLDCHLMIEDPVRWAPAYAEAGARNVTIHAEAASSPVRTLRMIRSAGARAGLGINPATPVEPFADLLPEIDMLLLMTVEPGFGGQPFLDMVLPKLRRARGLVSRTGAAVWLQVDGGVSEVTIERCADGGADLLVAGSAVYGADAPAAAVQALRAQAQRATARASWPG